MFAQIKFAQISRDFSLACRSGFNPTFLAKARPASAKFTGGFSLLELLVVITLLGLLSLSAVVLVDNVDEQDRFETTRTRLAQIRYAVVGDVSRTINGEPAISGYVADMGRLPQNIQELVELGNQPVWEAIPLSEVRAGLTGEIWGGWRGPYLPSTPELNGGSTFRDGWALAVSPVLPNYGWLVTPTGALPNHTAINVQSYGVDGVVGGAEYGRDFPDAATAHLVSATDWQLSASNINFNVIFNKPPIADEVGLELRIYAFEDDALINTRNLSVAPNEELSGTFGLSAVAASPNTKAVSIASAARAMGQYAAVVWCTAQAKVYDGDCVNPATHLPVYFTLLPNTPLPVTQDIHWNIE
jgi:prepilin-type N-terminal cleavage/methylation domain-containing protein